MTNQSGVLAEMRNHISAIIAVHTSALSDTFITVSLNLCLQTWQPYLTIPGPNPPLTSRMQCAITSSTMNRLCCTGVRERMIVKPMLKHNPKEGEGHASQGNEV